MSVSSSILFVGAHADDIEIGAGGTCALLCARGFDVHIVVLSDEDVPSMLKGGKHGPSVVPGKADESLLFRMATHRVEPVMPPAGKKDTKPLTPDELGLIKLWIDAGARDDSDENSEDDSEDGRPGDRPGTGPAWQPVKEFIPL